MNTIYLVSDLRPAGPTNQAYNLITGLSRLDCNPILVTLFEEPRDSWIERFRIVEGKFIQLYTDRKHLKEAARRLDKIIADSHVLIVHSSGMSADTVNRYIKSPVYKLTTIRQEFNVIGEKHNKLVRFVSRMVTKTNYKAMDMRVACSHILANNVQEATGLRIESVENGVDNDRFVPLENEKKYELRKQLGLPLDKKIYISTGVFYNGETYHDVEVLANGRSNIILTGKKSDPLQYYQASDIFVSTSLAEGLPNTVMEAMACGLPCILSDIGPHKEIVDYNSNAGILFKTQDYLSLKNILNESFNWDLSNKRKDAISIIDKYLSKYVMANNYYNLYNKLLKNE